VARGTRRHRGRALVNSYSVETLCVNGGVELIAVKRSYFSQQMSPSFILLHGGVEAVFLVIKSGIDVTAVDMSGERVAISEVTAHCPELAKHIDGGP